MSEGGFFSVAGGASEDGSDLGEECGLETSRLDALGADVESSYASARPVRQLSLPDCDAVAAQHGLQTLHGLM
jgi:hypothetical protein